MWGQEGGRSAEGGEGGEGHVVLVWRAGGGEGGEGYRSVCVCVRGGVRDERVTGSWIPFRNRQHP